MAIEAAASCHHLPKISPLCASFSILPHDTTPIGTPKPRKLKMTSDLINATTKIDICTRAIWLTLGKIWTNIRRILLTPIALAASTYSRAVCFMYSARTKRKTPVQPVRPKIRMIDKNLSAVITQQSAKLPTDKELKERYYKTSLGHHRPNHQSNLLLRPVQSQSVRQQRPQSVQPESRFQPP